MSEYGKYCGTFLGWWVKDPNKKACILEKKVSKHEAKCKKGNVSSCATLARSRGELTAIQTSIESPVTTLQLAKDMELREAQMQYDISQAQTAVAEDEMTKTLSIALIVGVTAVGAAMMLKK